MKLSVKVHYGLQAVLQLALNYESGALQIGEIAKDQQIPIRFLEQLLLTMKKAGLLISHRGKSGGYALGKHPADISLLDIIETLDGPIEISTRKMKRNPVLYEMMTDVQTRLRAMLKNLTIEDLVIKKRQSDRAYIYNI
jgi:Rrf2 family cysteine metabolism transcriptional repressor